MIACETSHRDHEQIAASGGRARAKALTPARKKEIAKQGATARWGEKKPATDVLADNGKTGPERAISFVMAALEQAVCYVFGDDSPDAHWSKRFYFCRIVPRRPGTEEEKRRGTFFHGSVWSIERKPWGPEVWSRQHGGLWLGAASVTDEKDPDAVRWTFADGWAECERILVCGMHLPAWQVARIAEHEAAVEAAGRCSAAHTVDNPAKVR